MTEQPKETKHREVIRKENYFSVAVKEGEVYTIAVDGIVVVSVALGDDCTVNSYVKRDAIPMQYKE